MQHAQEIDVVVFRGKKFYRLFYTLCDVFCRSSLKQIVPSSLERLAGRAPRERCATAQSTRRARERAFSAPLCRWLLRRPTKRFCPANPGGLAAGPNLASMERLVAAAKGAPASVAKQLRLAIVPLENDYLSAFPSVTAYWGGGYFGQSDLV